MEEINIDLHIHTTASDGMVCPCDIIDKAKENDLLAIAITDHDTTSGISLALQAGRKAGVEVIPGIEFSVNHTPLIHILGLFLDVNNDRLIEYLNYLAKVKMSIFTKAVKCVEEYGVSIKKHLKTKKIYSLKTLIRYLKEIMTIPPEAVDIMMAPFINDWKNCLLHAGECIQLIHKCNGLAFLAHPMLYGRTEEDIYMLVSKLRSAGLDGVEAYHPAHTLENMLFLTRVAKDLELLISAGSDYHMENDTIGLVTPQNSTLNMRFSYTHVNKMKDKLGRAN